MKKSLATLSLFAFAAIFLYAENTPPQTVPGGISDDEQAIVDAAIKSLPPLFETRTRIFSVCAENTSQMRRVAAIARRLEGHLAAILDWNFNAQSARIPVWIENNSTNEKTLFEVSPDFRRTATCTFNADPKTLSDYAIAFALAQTLLWQYGKEFKLAFTHTQPPLWAVSAIATETEIYQNNGRFLLLRERSGKARPLDVENFFTPHAHAYTSELPDAQFQINAFWFYRFLRRQKLAPWQNFSNRFREILQNPKEAFSGAEEIPDWAWATAFFATVEQSPEGTESLVNAQKRFADSMQFLARIDGKEMRLSANELIAHRDLIGIKKLAYARLRELNERLISTNPVWHNAFVELGVFLEMIAVVADRSDKLKEGASVWAPDPGAREKIEIQAFNAQWEKIKSACSEAEILQKEILSLLKNSGENPPETEARQN